MSTEHYADMVRQLMGRRKQEPPPPRRVHDRPLVWAAERALRRRGLRRRLVRLGAVASAVAVVALGIGGAGWLFFGGRLRVQTAVRDLAPARSGSNRQETVLPVGAQLASPADSELRLSTADGSDLILEPGSEVAVLQAGSVRRYGLRRGAVRIHVAKLRAGERFLVTTDDAEVEVRGTVFRVALGSDRMRCPAGAGGAAGSLTRVSVQEGVVEVRSRGAVARLVQGEQWPGACAPSASGAPVALVDAEEAGGGSARQAPAHAPDGPRSAAASRARGSASVARFTTSRARGRFVEPGEGPGADADADADAQLTTAGRAAVSSDATTKAPLEDASESFTVTPAVGLSPPSFGGGGGDIEVPAASELAAQNQLYGMALAAKRRHRPNSAVRLLAQFLERFPTSPLAESARAQRMEILAGIESPEAERAARDYLDRYPDGFARIEALRVAGSP